MCRSEKNNVYLPKVAFVIIMPNNCTWKLAQTEKWSVVKRLKTIRSVLVKLKIPLYSIAITQVLTIAFWILRENLRTKLNELIKTMVYGIVINLVILKLYLCVKRSLKISDLNVEFYSNIAIIFSNFLYANRISDIMISTIVLPMNVSIFVVTK